LWLLSFGSYCFAGCLTSNVYRHLGLQSSPSLACRNPTSPRWSHTFDMCLSVYHIRRGRRDYCTAEDAEVRRGDAEEMQRRCRGTEVSHRAHRAHGVSERKRIIALSSLFPVSSVISVVQFSVLLRDLSAKLCALCVKDLVRPSRETGVRWYNIYCVPATWHFVRPLFPGCSHREYLPPVRLFASEERVFLRHSMSLGF
jgi:hypothetical protein